MDMNEMFAQQLAANPQFAAQVLQMMQQNGMVPQMQGNQKPPMNWNMPTNPMSAMWYNFMNQMNNQNAGQQPVQNQPQPQSQSVTNNQAQPSDNASASIRVIKSPNEIRPDEIPMNGAVSLFLQDDLSVIYGKRWTNNGTVDNLRFVLAQDDQKEEPSSDSSKLSINVEELFTRISDMIDEKLSRLAVPEKTTPSKFTNNKKGVESNGV